MEPSTRRLSLVAACVLGLAAVALLRPRAPEPVDDYGPDRSETAPERLKASSESQTTEGPGATNDAPAGAFAPGSAARRLLRTDTVEVRDVPPPGKTGSASARAARSANFTAASAAGAGAGGGATTTSGAHWTPVEGLPEAKGPSTDSRGVSSSGGSSNGGSSSGATDRSAKSGRPAKASDAGASSVSSDARVAAKATSLVSQARALQMSDSRGAEPDISTPRGLGQAVMQQVAKESAVDADGRKKLADLGSSADIEQQRQAAKETLAAHGQPTDEMSVSNALGTATSPPREMPPKAKMEATVASQSDYYPGPNGAPPKKQPGPAYKPAGPPPASLKKTYCQYKSAFEEAKKNFGVEPCDILAIIQQESGFGVNMGNTHEPTAIANRKADRAAAAVLEANGQFPAPLDQLRGSPTGALGHAQFQPATLAWMGKGNPFDLNVTISNNVPKLLKINGYPNREQAFCRYYGSCAKLPYGQQVIAKSEACKAQLQREPNCP